jgi:hypothetical protein
MRSRLLAGLRPVVAALVVCGAASERAIAQTPLPRAHAHNDYEHARPLRDALDQGFCSVEADIYLINGRLLVAHDLDKTRPDRTLEALYLDPLRADVGRHNGRVFPGGPPVTLLIDFKSEAESTYRVLREKLEAYRDMLTSYSNGSVRTNAVTIILSGNRPWKTVASETNRLVFLDGRLPDLDSNPDSALVPLVSDNWRSHFRWRGEGEFPAEEREKLARLVERAHQQGRRIRFWAAPDQPSVWRAHWEAGVDLINTDRLAELSVFLSSRP